MTWPGRKLKVQWSRTELTALLGSFHGKPFGILQSLFPEFGTLDAIHFAV